MKKLHFCLLIPLIFLFRTLFSQDVSTTTSLNPSILSSSGFEREGSKGLLFSVGSLNSVIVLKSPYSDSKNGIQDTTAVSDVLPRSILPNSEESEETTSIVLYPNPFIDRITLNIENFENREAYHFRLFDLSGNLLNTKSVEHGQEEILLNFTSKGIFVLILYKNQKEIKSFKLIPAKL